MKKYNVSINHSKRVITIKVYENGKLSEIYKDDFASREDIENAEYWTENDIKDYLRMSGSYYKVK